MNFIVSESADDFFTQFMVERSLKSMRSKLKELNSGADLLVIHSFPEKVFEAGVFLTEFKDLGVKSIIYINSNPDPVILNALNGVNGRHISDEFYLESEEDLLSLVEDLSVDTEVDVSSVGILQDFVTDIGVKVPKNIIPPVVIENATSAIQDLRTSNDYHRQLVSTLGRGTMEVFRNAKALIKDLASEKEFLRKKLDELENSINTTPSVGASFGGSINFYSSYRYNGNAKVLLIREYSPCRYLTSFCLGYLSHLHYEKNKRVKLVFIHQKGTGVAKRYANWVAINDQNSRIDSLYDHEVLTTNDPKKDVLKTILERAIDIFIVVDRLYGTDDIITGRTTRVCAVGSSGDIARYGINPENTIFSVTAQPKQLFELPVIRNFPLDPDARYSVYATNMRDSYIKLDEKLNLH